jgi:hypothetical protein
LKTEEDNCKRTGAAKSYLDIVVEDEMALAVLGKQVKSIVVGEVLELSSKGALHFRLKARHIDTGQKRLQVFH